MPRPSFASATGAPSQMGRRASAVQVFCHRQNLDAGRIHSARADQIMGVPDMPCMLGQADAMIWQGVSY